MMPAANAGKGVQQPGMDQGGKMASYSWALPALLCLKSIAR